MTASCVRVGSGVLDDLVSKSMAIECNCAALPRCNLHVVLGVKCAPCRDPVDACRNELLFPVCTKMPVHVENTTEKCCVCGCVADELPPSNMWGEAVEGVALNAPVATGGDAAMFFALRGSSFGATCYVATGPMGVAECLTTFDESSWVDEAPSINLSTGVTFAVGTGGAEPELGSALCDANDIHVCTAVWMWVWV